MQHDILIIYEPKAQKPLINGLLREMRRCGLNIDAFNMLELQYHCDQKEKSLFSILRLTQKWIVTRLFNKKVLYPFILRHLAKDARYIDIHYFTRDYVPFLEHFHNPYKITLWGSDLYRESSYWQERKRGLYRRAKVIQVETPSVEKDVIKYEPKLQEHIEICNFGVNLLTVIDSVKKSRCQIIDNKKGKIVITCGYNGHKGQQHLTIFKALASLPQALKDSILLLIPATYGLKNDYKKQLDSELRSLDVEYHLFVDRLSDEDLAALRLQTDIVVNIQITDSLSSSLIEHLYAGNILIAGDWLPYDIFDANGIFYMQTSLKELSANIETAIRDISRIKTLTMANSQRIYQMASWAALSTKQYEIYQKLLRD